MSDFVVKAELRSELGKNANRRLRSRGMIPGVVYGQGLENVSVSLDPAALVDILHSDMGRNTIFMLNYGDKAANVLIRDYQLDPVRGELIHADLQSVAMDELMVFEIPIEVKGTAKGVKNGGVLDVVLREVEVECLPADVPDHVMVDVSELEIGDSLRVGALKLPSERMQMVSESDLVVLTVVPPRVTEEVAETGLEEEAIEPELIRKGREEEAEE